MVKASRVDDSPKEQRYPGSFPVLAGLPVDAISKHKQLL
jgi:hypothetical protein